MDMTQTRIDLLQGMLRTANNRIAKGYYQSAAELIALKDFRDRAQAELDRRNDR